MLPVNQAIEVATWTREKMTAITLAGPLPSRVATKKKLATLPIVHTVPMTTPVIARNKTETRIRTKVVDKSPRDPDPEFKLSE